MYKLPYKFGFSINMNSIFLFLINIFIFIKNKEYMSIIITSFFTNNGIPAIGLSPSIRIWEINSGNTLVIGFPEGTHDSGNGIGTDGTMLEIYDNTVGIPGSGPLPPSGSRDGFYKFEFTEAMGFDELKTYLVRCDGGSSLNTTERYQISQIDPSQNVESIADSILNAPATNHLVVGSIGEKINYTHSNTEQLALSVLDVQQLIELLMKYETNRTKIDPVNQTLTVYDDDCTTPLRTFKLLDSNGIPSVSEVCERIPQASGTSDGQTVCV
jgi:hypothetical protein